LRPSGQKLLVGSLPAFHSLDRWGCVAYVAKGHIGAAAYRQCPNRKNPPTLASMKSTWSRAAYRVSRLFPLVAMGLSEQADEIELDNGTVLNCVVLAKKKVCDK
jgi:hypothetical protein